MVRYKVKFDDEGKICPNSIEQLKRNPECGVYFYEEKPFNPHNKPPRNNPFEKIDKNLTIDAFGKFIPEQDERPTTTIPRGRGLTLDVLKQNPFQSPELPQDYTTELVQGKKGVLEALQNRKTGGYQSVPVNNELSQDVVSFENITYANQEPDTITRNVVGELDDLVGGVELSDLRQSRIIPEPPPSPPGEKSRGKKPMRKKVVDKIRSLFRRRKKVGGAGTSTEEPPISQEQLEIELQELNITDLPPEIIEEIVQTEINTPIKTINEQIREVTESMNTFGETMIASEEYLDFLEEMVVEVTTLFVNEPNDENRLRLEETERELAEARVEREVAKKEFANSERRLNELNQSLKRIEELKTIFPEIPEPPPSPPGEAGPSRDITEEELIEIQMEDIKAKQRSKGVLSRKLADLEEIVVISPAREEELILRAAERFTSKDKPKVTFNEVKKILNKLVPKMVRPERVYDVLNDNNLYDAYYEKEYMKIRTEDREYLRRFAKQNDARARARAQGIEMQDTNLVPKEATAQQPLEIDETTGLIDRPGTGFEPRTRGIVQKEITKRAGKLPSELGELVRNIAPPSVDRTTTFDEEFVGELREVQLTEATRPSLSIGERIRTTTTAELGVGGAGLGVGLGAGFASAKLLENIGVKNPAIIGLTTGGVAGGATGLTTYALERAAGRAVTGVGRSLATGIAEGGILGLATVPADMILNKKLVEGGMSHTSANLLSTTVTAGGLTGLIFLAAALGPETGGASLVLAAGALAVSEVIAFFSGQSEDKKEQERKDEITKIQTTNIYRKRLVESLEKNNYDYTTAIKKFKDKDKLGMDQKDWKPFMMRLYNTFNKSDFSNKKLPVTDTSKTKLTDTDKTVAVYMSRYIARKVVEKTCANSTCSPETLANMPRELNEDEIKFLTDKTANTWRDIADVSVEQSYMENKVTNKRVEEARKIVINNWKQNKELPDGLDPNILDYSNLDGQWLDTFKKYINDEAVNFAIDAYNDNQTKQNELPQYIRDALAYQPDKVHELNQYYKHIEDSAKNINVTTEQYITLQKTDFTKQKNLYEKYQFENKQATPEVVEQAVKIASIEDKVRASGYYDLDLAILKTDPTSIATFRPTDSQIFIAHSAGLTLQEYVNYIHELAKGEDGNFDNLPVLTNAEKVRLGFADFDEFREEVTLAGQDANAYEYDPQNQLIYLKPVTQIPVNEADEEAHVINDRQLHEQEESNIIHSVVGDVMSNLHLERVNQIQTNVEQHHRDVLIDSNLNRATSEGIPNVPAASS